MRARHLFSTPSSNWDEGGFPPVAERFAVIDIGTNTALLLVVEIGDGGVLRVLQDIHAIARLGEDVDRSHRICDAAYARFREVMQRYCGVMQSLKVERVIAVGTSALRDAQNRQEIVHRASVEFGIEIEILSGEEEARWGYVGAFFGLTIPAPLRSQEDAACVIDIGGGSVEISFGTGSKFTKGVSLNIGAVRMTERCFGTIPVASGAEAEARRWIQSELIHTIGTGQQDARLIAVAGTPSTLAAMEQGLERFDAEKVQNYVLTHNAIDTRVEMLLRTPTTRVLKLFPVINKSRADILPAGTLILQEVMTFLSVKEVGVSVYGLRYGIALREQQRIIAAWSSES